MAGAVSYMVLNSASRPRKLGFSRIGCRCYPGAKRRAAEKVAEMLEEVGRTGAKWEWVTVRGFSKRLALVPASVPAGQTMQSFGALADQLTCGHYDTRGAAKAQCACCADLLCADCAEDCLGEGSFGFAALSAAASTNGSTEPCPYAVCPPCAVIGVVTVAEAYMGLASSDTPRPIKPACSKCPDDLRWCPSHPDPGYTLCTACVDARCAEHMQEEPAQHFCSRCSPQNNFNFVLCDKVACHARSRRKLMGCPQCRKLICDRCAPGGRCPCGGRVVKYEPWLWALGFRS